MTHLLSFDSVIASHISIPFDFLTRTLAKFSQYSWHLKPVTLRGDRKEEEAGWVEREMSAVDCGARFAMLKKR